MTNKIKKSIIVTVILFGAFFGIAHAQVQSSDVTLSINPIYPAPNQSTVATLGSFTTDLNKANISWSVNGKEVISGIGKKSFSFNVGNAGVSLTLDARINTVDGQSVLKNLTVIPTEVDMLWEATDSYVPPFYKGKALVPSQGSFKVVAIPNLITAMGKSSADNLSYTWTKDNSSQPDSSGWGKNYFIFKNSYLNNTNKVEVTASDISGTSNTSGSVTLQTVIPKIIFYQRDLSLGTQWTKSLTDGFALNSTGEVIVAEPYFFSPKDISSSELTFDWSLNGGSIQTPNPKNILSIKPENGKSGSAKIKVAINNTLTLFQNLEQEINMNF